jgi:hypothetical protein
MRPPVGEEMSRQPSLPSLTTEGTLVRTSRFTRAKHCNTDNRAGTTRTASLARDLDPQAPPTLLTTYKRLTSVAPCL